MTKRTRAKKEAEPAQQEPSLPNRQPKARTEEKAVGYGRPPRHSRFKKGQSGNPKGRRKHSRNFKTIIREALTGRISIREGEKRRSISKLEGVVLRQLEGALKGNERAALAALKIATQVGLLEDAGSGFEEQPLTATERELLQEILDKAGVGTPGPTDEDPS
jgi:hypothetical protein